MEKGILKGRLFLLLAVILISCSKDVDDDETSFLDTWIETAPVPGRTVLVFGLYNRLTRIDGEGNKEIFIYRIEDNILFLRPASGLDGTSELIFEQINPNQIKVENLYPAFPEAERTFIIFERE